MSLSRRTAIGLLSAASVLFGTQIAAAQDAIKIGVTAPLSGPAAEIGHLQLEGARLGVEKVNAAGGVLGRQLELVVEDDQTTNPGIVLAFSRLINRGDIVAALTSVRSTQVNAIAGDAEKAGIPVFFGGTDPTLTHLGNPWMFRMRPNDTYSAKVFADFGVNQLGKRKWAVLHSTDAFGTNGSKALIAQLKELGIEPVLVQTTNNGQVDFSPVVLAVRQSGADIIATYIPFENDLAVLGRQLQQLGVKATLIGNAAIISATTMKLAGPALYGSYAVTDFNPEANPVAKAYHQEFSAKVGAAADYASAWTYDSILVLAQAIKSAGSTEPAKLREALLAIRGFEGAVGTYNFDENGDGLRGYNIVRNDQGKVIFDRHISFTQ